MADDTRGRFQERIRSLIASGSEERHAAPVIHIGKFGEAQGLGGAPHSYSRWSRPLPLHPCNTSQTAVRCAQKGTRYALKVDHSKLILGKNGLAVRATILTRGRSRISGEIAE